MLVINMVNFMKRIALGESFTNTIDDNRIYIDKTETIYALLTNQDRIFISRPRRFGKSMLFDTIGTLYEEGVEPYFKDTWIYDKWEEKKYPVLRFNFLDFNKTSYESFCEDFVFCINNFLSVNKFDLVINNCEPYRAMKLLINYFIAQKKRIVILIDEYDSQLVANINNVKLYNKFQESFRDLYGTIKGKKIIKFLGISGVTRLKDVTIFSVGSDIKDISYFPRYSAIVGFTREEISKYYFDYLNLAVSITKDKDAKDVTNEEREELLNRLALEYDGYCFDSEYKTKVFSTFSVNSFFSFLKENSLVSYSDYWYLEGGIPSVLTKYLEHHEINFLDYQNKILDVNYDDFINPSSLLSINEKVLMSQTGYLTLKSSMQGYNVNLGIPNNEVERSLIRLTFFKNFGVEVKLSSENLLRFEEGKVEEIKEVFDTIINTIPYHYFPFTKERDVAISIYMFLKGCACQVYSKFIKDKDQDVNGLFDAKAEEASSQGRCDLVIQTLYRKIAIGIKFAQDEKEIDPKLNEAIEQIKSRNYGDTMINMKLLRIALVFNGKDRKIAYFKEVKD